MIFTHSQKCVCAVTFLSRARRVSERERLVWFMLVSSLLSSAWMEEEHPNPTPTRMPSTHTHPPTMT